MGHKKSRLGCQRCKQRRVKCDEQAPCARCLRRGERCSLAEPQHRLSASPGEQAHAAGSDEATWIQDLELMHHYTAIGYAMASVNSDRLRLVWKETVPLMAMDHPCLMHGLLATSAMHLAYLRPDKAQKYLCLCDQHQVIAIAQFRKQLGGVSSHNAAALFALAALLSAAALARMLPRVVNLAPDNAGSVIEWILESITLTRGARDVLTLGSHWVYESPMLNAVLGFDPPPNALAPAHVREHMHKLSELCIDTCTDPTHRAICLEAIQDLRTTYDTMCTLTRNQLEVGHLMAWFVRSRPGFLDLLREHHSMAVLILCHFWTLWGAFRHLWYVQDLATLTLPILEGLLDDVHRPWLKWAKAELGNDMPCLNSTMHTSSVASAFSTSGGPVLSSPHVSACDSN